MPKFGADFLIVLAVFLINLIIQNWNLGNHVLPGSDEGVYLYSARLLGQGYIPYKDFFLAHPPYLLYLVNFLMWVSGFNMDVFRFLLTVLVFSTLFPIYYIILKF